MRLFAPEGISTGTVRVITMSDYRIQIGDTSIEATSVVNSVGVYNLSCDIVRVAKTRTSRGPNDTPSTIVSSMPCSIRWIRQGEKRLADKDTRYRDAVVHCRKPATTVLNSDKVYHNSEYFDIVGIYDVNDLGVLLEISIKRNG